MEFLSWCLFVPGPWWLDVYTQPGKAHLNQFKSQWLWSAWKAMLHINVLEFRAIWVACKAFLPLPQGLTIEVLTDTTTAMYYIDRCGDGEEGRRGEVQGQIFPSLPQHTLFQGTKPLWNWCILHHFTPVALHLLGLQNPLVDQLSKDFSVNHKLNLNDTVLHVIIFRWLSQ